jgi:Flp pilus assembly protein TadD
MKSISTFALAAALVVGGAMLTAPIDQAHAQKKKKGKAAEPAVPAMNITAAARPALIALENAVKAKDAAAYATALPAAEAVATTPDEKYLIARHRYSFTRAANDKAGQSAALEALLATTATPAAEQAAAHSTLGIAAYEASNWQKAHDHFTQVIALRPDDSDSRYNLALSKRKLKKDDEALALLETLIDTNKGANKPVPESWYRAALDIAYARGKPQAMALSRETLAAYPTSENWRNALIVYRESVREDEAASLDVLRLTRASKAMTAKNQYYDMALYLTDAGFPGEAKAVMDEAMAARLAVPTDDIYRRVQSYISGKLAEDRASLGSLETRAKSAATGRLAYRTADAILGYGEYARAAALYRVALSKGGDIDVGLANTHLGIALALAGDKAGAEAAFRAVTGPRAPVAALWLSWLATNPQG